MRYFWSITFLAGLSTAILSLPVRAEAYLAVRTGAKCVACHVNPTGGGKRTEYGNLYGNTSLPAGRLDSLLGSGKTKSGTDSAAAQAWDGRITDYFAVGGDLRASLKSTIVPNTDNQLAFDLDRTTLYFDLRIIPNRLSLYVDERVAPGAALNREAYLLFWSEQRGAYFKAGRLFLPYGLRLEDDTAFVRRFSGINFNSSDNGVEGGLEQGPWSLNLAVTNGTAGASETNTGKQFSLLTSLAYRLWRVGASYNANDNGANDRHMQNVFAGLRTGFISWLGEVDYFIDDGTSTGRRKSWAGLAEANAEVIKGHNLKLTYEYYDSNLDVEEDQRTRSSLVWEYTPFQAMQLRAGYRRNKGIPQSDLQNTEEIFLQLHTYL